ncbi:PREDICTED: uncharacterized protein LOC106309065 [Brassica oleracea var. oleracea]|nr:PREDICTED: uncharacterized protein LOC106309065 [Brassica oleracea var. oleracea]
MNWNKNRNEELLPNLSTQIQCLRPGHPETEDIFIWQPLPSSVYSARSGYCAAVSQKQTSCSTQTFDWIRDVWKQECSPQMKVFLWSIIQKALPLGENLQSKGVRSEAVCIKCKEQETAIHTFFICPFAREVWDKVPLKNVVHIATGDNIKEVIAAFRTACCLPPTGISRTILPWIVWSLWTARNLHIFENKVLSAEEVATNGLSLAREWINAQGTVQRVREEIPRSIKSKTPQANPLLVSTCRSDAAWDKSSKRAGLAWSITGGTLRIDRQGSLTENHVSSPIVAEALALRSGLITAVELEIPRIRIFSDNSTLIRAINFDMQTKEIFGIIRDIHRISSAFIEISFHHLSLDLIKDVDQIAKRTLRGPNV